MSLNVSLNSVQQCLQSSFDQISHRVGYLKSHTVAVEIAGGLITDIAIGLIFGPIAAAYALVAQISSLIIRTALNPAFFLNRAHAAVEENQEEVEYSITIDTSGDDPKILPQTNVDLPAAKLLMSATVNHSFTKVHKESQTDSDLETVSPEDQETMERAALINKWNEEQTQFLAKLFKE